MEAFPTPAALAASDPERAVELWGDLGYLRRLHHLRQTAVIVTEAGWPTDLTVLPGVGPYTAAAVASFAFGAPVAAVDTNHRRVLSRWVGRPLRGRELADQAAELVEGSESAAWNQAVMDLGALVCNPVPRCEECPVSAWCVDPCVYEPPPRQSEYPGSLRQVRAAVVRTLARQPLSSTAALAETVSSPHLEDALAALRREGMITGDKSGWSLS